MNDTRISRSENPHGPSVQRVQLALLGWDPNALPGDGADGWYGDETAGVVARFKVEELGVAPGDVIDDVGPRTVVRLDEMALADELLPERVPDDPVSPELVAESQAAAAWLLALPGVNGVAPGYRTEGEEIVEDLVVHVLVSDAGDVPSEVPFEIGGVPVMLYEMDVIPIEDRARYTQLKGGIRVSYPGGPIGPGTMGAIVRDVKSGELLGLSCQHVVGSPTDSNQPYDVVWQPEEPGELHHAVHTGPIPLDDEIGSVAKAEYPRAVHGIGGALVSDADAAVFRLDLGLGQADPRLRRTASAAIVGPASLGPDLIPAVSAVREPELKTVVRKRGFVTHETFAQVMSNHATVSWRLGPFPAFSALTEQAIVIGQGNSGGPFCAGGDSGSLVIGASSDEGYGLLWAKELGGRVGVMSKLRTVELRLGVSAAWGP